MLELIRAADRHSREITLTGGQPSRRALHRGASCLLPAVRLQAVGRSIAYPRYDDEVTSVRAAQRERARSAHPDPIGEVHPSGTPWLVTRTLNISLGSPFTCPLAAPCV
jgi:hypothetical protein